MLCLSDVQWDTGEAATRGPFPFPRQMNHCSRDMVASGRRGRDVFPVLPSTSQDAAPQELLPHLCDPRVPVCRLASKALKQSGEALSRRSLGLYICWGDCYTCFPPCGWKLIIEAMIYQALTTFNLSLTISWGRYWYICLVYEAWVR